MILSPGRPFSPGYLEAAHQGHGGGDQPDDPDHREATRENGQRKAEHLPQGARPELPEVISYICQAG